MQCLALGNAGIGDTDLDRSPRIDGGLDLGHDVILIAHIHRHGVQPLGGDLLQHLLSPSGDGDLGALRGQCAGDGEADAGAAARDQRMFSSQRCRVL